MKTLSLSASRILAAIIIALFVHNQSAMAQVGLQADLNDDSTVNISDISYLIGLVMNRNTDEAVEFGLCPNAMHPHVIDLGRHLEQSGHAAT